MCEHNFKLQSVLLLSPGMAWSSLLFFQPPRKAVWELFSGRHRFAAQVNCPLKAQPQDMSFLSGGTPTALSHFCVCKFKCPWSPGLAGCPSTRRESLCPYKSSFELIICLLGQSVSLCVGKIILRSGLGSEEFRALAEQWEGRSEQWVAPQGKDRDHRASRGLEDWVLVLVLPQTLAMAMGKSQVT